MERTDKRPESLLSLSWQMCSLHRAGHTDSIMKIGDPPIEFLVFSGVVGSPIIGPMVHFVQVRFHYGSCGSRDYWQPKLFCFQLTPLPF
jgi:hypothetical protein